MSDNAETNQKISNIQALSRSVANSCKQAQTPLPTRLGWLMQAADDCDKLLVMLKAEARAESEVALERNRRLGRNE